MADGSVFELVRGILGPLDRFLDYLFYAGVLYGSRSIGRLLARTCRGFRTYFIPIGRVSKQELRQTYGKWAVITGGTTGIGVAYAHEFAKREINVVLISRSYDDLVNIISDLQTRYNIQIYGIYADFSLGSKVYQDVEDTLKELEIGILVNNVSISYEHPQYFALVPHQKVWQIVDVNVTGVTIMTHMLLPKMLKRGKGAIINVCSMSASTPPIPLTAQYSASMAYVDTFSRALEHENRHKGIYVQTLLPCFVAGPGRTPTMFVPSPETYVRHALATLGVSNRLCGYWPHGLQSWFCNLIPEWLWVWLTHYFNAATRRRCLKERELNGVPKFSRKIHEFAPSHARGGRHSSSTTRPISRTPSPQARRISAISVELAPESRSPSALRRGLPGRVSTSGGLHTDMKRKISLDEITRSRSGSHGLIPPPIQEDSSFTSPLSTPEIGQVESPLFDNAIPRRSSTSSNIDPPTRRLSTYKITSRVLVMPSVAKVSYSQEQAD